jgi:hypothetical protein
VRARGKQGTTGPWLYVVAGIEHSKAAGAHSGVLRPAGDVARMLVGEVWLRADGAGGGSFAECSGMAKALASAALRGIAERDVLADVAFPVEKRHLGVPQLGGADKRDDHGGGGFVLSVLGGGKPSGCLSQLRSWIQHLDLFTGVFWRGGGGDPIQNVSGPSLADVGRYGGISARSLRMIPRNGS